MKPILEDIRHAQCVGTCLSPHTVFTCARKKVLRMLGSAMDKAAEHAPNWSVCWRPKASRMKIPLPDISTREKHRGDSSEHAANRC
ncbi:hypothetical protein ACNKHK_26590 [Shigella flexneri]